MSLGLCVVADCTWEARYGTEVGAICVAHWHSPELAALLPLLCVQCCARAKPRPGAACCTQCKCRIESCSLVQDRLRCSGYCPAHAPCWAAVRIVRHPRRCGRLALCCYHQAVGVLVDFLCQRGMPELVTEQIARCYAQLYGY